MKDLGAEDIKSSSSSKDKDKEDDSDDEGASSADTSNDSVPKNPCGDQDKSSDDSSGKTSGELGSSTKANGKSGKKIEGNWTYDEIPEKYKKHIELPKFQPKYLKGSPFVQSGDDGQCTEFTWAMMNQLYKKDQPAFDGVTNGDSVYQIYKKRGAKTTHNPTVGYGFSSSPPYALAKIPGVGHTGVVAGVMDDGKFIIAQMNVDPDPAPSRTVLYSVIDGVPKDAGNDLIFFEGVGEPKKEYKKGK
ncbi:CHAP domain-containing protein [Listeria monocytogenes]|nr:CHAP domain-containing protein [Listeria monocytogenes]